MAIQPCSSVLLLYGSQTGNAEEISNLIKDDMQAKLPQQEVQCMSMLEYMNKHKQIDKLAQEKLVIIVCSTTGQGDPPDNAMRFWQRLNRKKEATDATLLCGVRYAILGLGDSNYDQFNNMAKRINKKFTTLGAQPFMKAVYADDATGLEDTVEPFRKDVVAAVVEEVRPVTVVEESKSNEPAVPLARTAFSPSYEHPVLFLYGSQTGNAEEISNLIKDDMQAKLPQQEVQCMSMLEYMNTHKQIDRLAQEKLVIIVCSTTGQGDPPDNAMRFWQRLNRKKEATDATLLCGVRYAILGLGDSNYDQFNNMAKRINKKFTTLGAQPFMKAVYADDATGLEDTVEPFRKDVVATVVEEVRMIAANSNTECMEEMVREKEKCVLISPPAVDVAGNRQVQAQASPCSAPASPGRTGSDGAGRTPPKVKKPQGLPRYRRCEVELDLQGCANAPSAGASKASKDSLAEKMLLRRWQGYKAQAGGECQAELNGCAPEAPVMAKLKSARFLTTETSTKHVLHVEFSLPQSTGSVTYRPGDALGVYAPNDSSVVDALLVRLGATDIANQRFRLRHMVTTNASRAAAAASVASEAVTALQQAASKALEATQNAAQLAASGTAASAAASTAETMQSIVALATAACTTADSARTAAKAEAASAATQEPDYKQYVPQGSQQGDGVALAEDMTIREAFLFLYDLTSPPRKAFLRMLAEQCSEAKDKTQLYLLCSREGREAYERDVVQQRTGVLDLLRRFPSCLPPLAHLMQMLPPLMPRYYSASSSPAVSPNSVEVALTLVEYITPPPLSIRRKGLCSFWLYHLCQTGKLLERDTYAEAHSAHAMGPRMKAMQAAAQRTDSPSTAPRTLSPQQQGKACIKVDTLGSQQEWTELFPGAVLDHAGAVCIPVFFRRSHTFVMPEELEKPLIMVGPGTGVAPFRSFLQQRQQMMAALSTGGVALGDWRGVDVELADDEEEDISDLYPTASRVTELEDAGKEEAQEAKVPAAALDTAYTEQNPAPATLFFGCRDKTQDFLYGDEFESMARDGLVNFHVAYSRAGPAKVYVQNLIELEGERIAKQILEHDAYVFVCGDGSKMAKDVMACLVSVLSAHSQLSKEEARAKVFAMMKAGHYVQDVWS